MEVLNISNVNAQGVVVLNDERLLELIQLYPFIYNPLICGYQNSDYSDWAWEKITTCFNSGYKDLNSPTFTVSELQDRWEKLKPTIKSLSRAQDINSIPYSLRRLVVKISAELEQQFTKDNDVIKPKSNASSILRKHSMLIEKLPLIQRQQLEAEIIDLILTAELDTDELTDEQKEQVDREYSEFLKAIRVKELFVLNGSNSVDSSVNAEPTEKNTEAENNLMCFETLTSLSPTSDIIIAEELQPITVKCEFPEKSKTSSTVPLQWKRFVPLHQAKKYIRPFKIKVKRINFNDFLIPLSNNRPNRL